MSEASQSEQSDQAQPRKRPAWYLSTAPCIASVFLWVGFYQPLAAGTVDRAGFGAIFVGFLLAGVLSYALFYHVPASVGFATRHSLAGVASSSFGAQGTWLAPGLLAGILITAWFGAALRMGAQLVLDGSGIEGGPGNVILLVPAVVIGVIACLTAAGGPTWVARVAVALSAVPLLTVAFLLIKSADGIQFHTVDQPEPVPAVLLLVHMVTAFAATICVAAPDFGRDARSSRDLLLGGSVGLIVPILYAGFLGVATTTGARVLDPAAGAGYVGATRGLGTGVPFLLAVTALPAASVFCLLAGRNLGVALPKLSAGLRTTIVGVGGVLFAATGVSDDLAGLATFTGAMLAPIAGVITADFLRAGWTWPQARPGINYAGFGALALGCLVGFLPFVFPGAQPAAVYSYLAGLLGYLFLCQIGLKPYRRRTRRRHGR